jgi:hypothetical protein
MFSELDTDAFFAYAKAHHRDLVQQADSDALRRCAVLQKQDKAARSRRLPALLRSIRHGQRAVRMRCQTLWQRWVCVARTWASRHPSHTPRTSRG